MQQVLLSHPMSTRAAWAAQPLGILVAVILLS